MSDDPQRNPEKVRSELALECTTTECVPWQGYYIPVCAVATFRHVIAFPFATAMESSHGSNVRNEPSLIT